MVPLLLKCGCLPLSLRLLVGRVFPLVLLPSPVLFIKKKKLELALPRKYFYLASTCFSI